MILGTDGSGDYYTGLDYTPKLTLRNCVLYYRNNADESIKEFIADDERGGRFGTTPFCPVRYVTCSRYVGTEKRHYFN